MALRQFESHGEAVPAIGQHATLPVADRSLTLLIDGVSINVPELDSEGYKSLRTNVSRLSQRMPDRLPDEEKLALIREVVREFEVYRAASENAVRQRQAAWRAVVAMLFNELLASMGISATSAAARHLVQQTAALDSTREIEQYAEALEEFLHPTLTTSVAVPPVPLRVADRTTANDNAAGLRGGGSAIEYLTRVMAAGRKGFVVLFNLSCLDVIGERFGIEAVEDCLMAVSAYLTHSLHNDDMIFHWSDSSLLAVLLDRPTQQIVTAELQRIATQNRDITINVGGRLVMLRIPLTFEPVPIEGLASPDDICRFASHRSLARSTA
jgi:GGDEF domain-containing protein